jgi:hypothetical protein
MKLQHHREQTAHLQAALLHSALPVRAQIPTAQQDSIRSPSSSRGMRLRGYRVFLLPVCLAGRAGRGRPALRQAQAVLRTA